MLFFLRNGVPLFVPAIFPTKDTLDSWPSFRLLYLIELISVLVMLPGTIMLIIAMKNTLRLFHRNLIQIIQVHLTAMTISEISRIPIMVYDIGLVKKSGTFDQLLFALFAVRFVSISFLVTTIPAAIVERVFASYYIHDYESARRAWISYLINGGSLVIAAAYYLLLLLLAIGLYMTASLLFVTFLIFVLPAFAMMVVHRRDAAKLRDLDNESGLSILNYTLSMKFQLEENVRVSKLVFNASIGYAMWGTVGTCLGVVTWAIFKEEQPITQLLAAFINIYLALTFAVFVWLSLAAIRRPRTLAMLFSKCKLTANNSPVRSLITEDTKIVMDQYFKQLDSLWAQPKKS